MNADLTAALVADAAVNPSAAVDFLLEHDVPLVDVLLAFAGTPPDWDTGLSQACLSEWLARKDPPDERGEKLASDWVYVIHNADEPNSWRACFHASVTRDDSVTKWPTEADARRYLKRRVLGLFPEVTRTLESRFSSEAVEDIRLPATIDDVLYSKGFRVDHPHLSDSLSLNEEDGQHFYWQTLAAPDWVPPSDEEWRRQPENANGQAQQIIDRIRVGPNFAVTGDTPRAPAAELRAARLSAVMAHVNLSRNGRTPDVVLLQKFIAELDQRIATADRDSGYRPSPLAAAYGPWLPSLNAEERRQMRADWEQSYRDVGLHPPPGGTVTEWEHP